MLLADATGCGTTAPLGGLCLGGALWLIGGTGRRVGESVVAGSLAALLLAVRLGSDVPEVGQGPVALRLLEAPHPTPFGCRLRVRVYGARPGDALLLAPPITCAWGRGQAAIAHVELGPLPSVRNPGGVDSAKRWARRGVHRTGRVVEHRIAAIGDPSLGPL